MPNQLKINTYVHTLTCVTQKSRPAACGCFGTKNRCIELFLAQHACARWPVSQFPLNPSSLPPPFPPKFPIGFCPSYSSDHVEPSPSPSKNASIHPSIQPTNRPRPSLLPPSAPFSLYSSPSYITARSLNSSSWRSERAAMVPARHSSRQAAEAAARQRWHGESPPSPPALFSLPCPSLPPSLAPRPSVHIPHKNRSE